MNRFVVRIVFGLALAAVLPSRATSTLLPPQQTGNFYVGDFANAQVVAYDASGALLGSFTAPGLSGPRGIVVLQDGAIYAASQFTNEVFVFDSERQFKTKFTSAELAGPTGMAVSDFGELYVSSFNNNRIVVFTIDGTFVRSFTGGGLNGPNCVAFDSSGEIYVSSALTNNIIKFDAQENLIKTFTGGGLASPMGIARDVNDILYVAGGISHNIVKFDTDGNYLGELAHPDLTGPQGTAFDQRGHLFSSSFFQNNIVEFDANGLYVQTITEGDLSVPRSIAFVPIPGPNDPHLIYTAEQLNAVGAEPNDWDKHFKLMADIDMSGYSYDAALIAPDVDTDQYYFQGTPYTGVFDGNGHTISHLTITGVSYLGLFGALASGAVVKDLGVTDINISGSGDVVGGLIGHNQQGAIVTRCNSTGRVSGDDDIGGLVGSNSGHIAQCYSASAASGNYIVGGLLGANEGEGAVIDCYSTGAVNGDDAVAGLVGFNLGDVTHCFSAGTVTGGQRVGGLVGWTYGSIVSSFWNIQTSSQMKMCGSQEEGAIGCDDFSGKTTAAMQTAMTYLEAGWDFVDETDNGTKDTWWILEGQSYPKLWWEQSTGDMTVLMVDDFESYNDLEEDHPDSNRVFLTWSDWFTPTSPNGAIAGNLDPPFMSSGHNSSQAMPVYYDNAGKVSEVGRTLYSATDWITNGATKLSMWIKGDSANAPDRIYVALSNAIVYHPDDAATQSAGWNE